MLNNKGFTLIEVLATLVILGVVLAIAIPMGTNAYESSKNKTEKIFVDKLARVVDDYITLHVSEFEVEPLLDGDGNQIKVQKCDLGEMPDGEDMSPCTKESLVYKITDDVTFQDIIDEELIAENEFINPKNRKKCEKESDIEIYQDDDSVNYFRFGLLDCISNNNIQINSTVPYVYTYDNATFFS